MGCAGGPLTLWYPVGSAAKRAVGGLESPPTGTTVSRVRYLTVLGGLTLPDASCFVHAFSLAISAARFGVAELTLP